MDNLLDKTEELIVSWLSCDQKERFAQINRFQNRFVRFLLCRILGKIVH